MRHKRQRNSFARSQHRLTGVVVSLFVLFIVASGIALNHAVRLGLDERHVQSQTLLDWYGIDPAIEMRHFRVAGRWLSHAGTRWYLDGVPAVDASQAVGAVQAGEWLLAAGPGSVEMLTARGERVERITWDRAGRGAIERIGLTGDGRAVLHAGDTNWMAGPDFAEWVPTDLAFAEIRWSSPEPADEVLQSAIRQARRGSSLSYETLLLDLHSGRFFGSWGVILYDILALALASLALSGLLQWWRGRNGKRRPNPRKRLND